MMPSMAFAEHTPAKSLRWFLVWGVALLAEAPPAGAQILNQYLAPDVYGEDVAPSVTVLSRGRPDYDAPGVRAGNFIIRPQLTENAGYESNVLGTGKAVGSALIQTNASLSAQSDWSRNSVRAEFSVDDHRYLSQARQSFTDWRATLGGSYEIGRDVLTTQYNHFNINQTSRDLDVPRLDHPVEVSVDSANLAYRVNFNRASVTPSVTVANYTYANGAAGGIPYPQDYRNRFVVTPSLTLGYEFSPRRSAVIVFRDANASYSNFKLGGARRDYNDPALLAGIDYDLTGLLRLRVLAGYEMRTFVSSAYKTINAPVIEATAIWTPTGLTTLSGTVARHIQDSTDETTAAFTQTSVITSVDHELLRNLLLRGEAGVYFGEYSGRAGNQTLYTAGASATYLTGRLVRLTASYEFRARDSARTVGGVSPTQSYGGTYTDHTVLLRVRIAL